MTGRNRSNSRSVIVFEWTASAAISAKEARFSNSGSRRDHSNAFSTANGVRSSRLAHSWSQISHESRVRIQRSACAFVTFSGSSTIVASTRASWIPLRHRAPASA